jgi:serine/threonine-protein kinase
VETDRNLLFGVLALQADLIDAPRFIEACALWATRKHTSLADLLVEKGWLGKGDRADVERLLERKLKKYGGDARASLAAVADVELRQSLAALPDPEVSRSIADLPPPADPFTASTCAYVPDLGERYVRTQLHATGGIGRVWLAYDAALGREVALKELRPDRADDAALRARFLREAQITGQLEHPGIVPVYEVAGPSPGCQPFYVMRFIRGRTLSESAQAYHHKRAAGQAGPVERVALLNSFVAVCNAVAYAHARGVLHRDLKGRNVVLGEYGEVVLLDWGLAKVLGPSGEEDLQGPPVAPAEPAEGDGTVPGTALGTPAYMAPEQAAGRLDLLSCRTDVYGLGAILYEILTGRPPHAGTSPEEVLREVREREPARPRALCAEVPAALEAVCLRALTRDPAGRYPSAAELAHEVQCWLADQPVAAYPEPLAARVGRWIRRHRTAVSVGGAAVVVAAVSLGVATALLTGAWREEHAARQLAQKKTREARDQRDETDRQRRQAEQNFRLARHAVERMLTRVGEEMALVPQMERQRRKLLQDALGFYKTFLKERGADPGVRVETARAYARVASIQTLLGRYAEAEKSYGKAIALWQKLAGDFPRVPEHRNDLAHGYHNLGALLHLVSRPREAEKIYEQILKIREGLAAEFPERDEYRLDLASSCTNLGVLLAQSGRGERAEQTFRRALKILVRRPARGLPLSRWLQTLAATHDRLAILLSAQGRFPEAEAAHRRSLALRQRLARAFPADPAFQAELGISYNNLGAVLQKAGRAGEAEKAYRKAQAVWDRVAADFPNTPENRRHVAVSDFNLGVVLSATGRPEEAREAFLSAAALWQKLVADLPRAPRYQADLARCHAYQAGVFRTLGRPREAAEAHRRALAIQEKLAAAFPDVPSHQLDLARTCRALGEVCRETGQTQEAEKNYRKALAVLEKLAAAGPAVRRYRDQLAAAHHDLGRLLEEAGRIPEAEKACGQALALAENLAADFPDVPSYRASLAKCHDRLGSLRSRAGRWKEVEEHRRKALAIRRQVAKAFPQNPEYREALAVACNNLGEFLQATGRRAEAEEPYRQAIAVRERLAAEFPQSPQYRRHLAGSLSNLATVLLSFDPPAKAGRFEESEKAMRRALQLQQQLVTTHPTEVAYRDELGVTCFHLGMVLGATGRSAEAERHCRRAVAIFQELTASSPEAPLYRERLASAYSILGVVLKFSGRAVEEEKTCRQALALWEKLAADQPTLPTYPSKLGLALERLAQVLQGRRDFTGASKVLERAVTAQQAALTRSPGNPAYQQLLRGHYKFQARVLGQLGDHRRTAEVAESLAALGSWQDCHESARMLARCVPLAEKDPALAEGKRKELAQEYASRAVKRLGQALQRGLRGADSLRRDAAFEPIRSRPDFQKLLADLEPRGNEEGR